MSKWLIRILQALYHNREVHMSGMDTCLSNITPSGNDGRSSTVPELADIRGRWFAPVTAMDVDAVGDVVSTDCVTKAITSFDVYRACQ
jgi:hypothetical protein